jgi:recombination protein RecR
MIPEPIKKLADKLAELPSIGPRQAMRLAFHIANSGKDVPSELATVLLSMLAIKHCAECFYTHGENGPLCQICGNPSRRADLVAIIERETDLLSLERTKKFQGRYLVIGELGRGGVLGEIQKMRLTTLISRLKKLPGGATEILIATNPTTYGDLAATVIADELKGVVKQITRLARGMPFGGEIAFADEDTLGHALERRQ